MHLCVFLFAVTDVKYEKILVQKDADDFDSSKEFRFNIPPNSDYFTSFSTDCQMVMDAVLLITRKKKNQQTETADEALWPERHNITLPLNSLNNYFQHCDVAFNYHNRLDADR